MFTNKAMVDTLATLALVGTSGTYAPVGPPQAFQARIICFTNTGKCGCYFQYGWNN